MNKTSMTSCDSKHMHSCATSKTYTIALFNADLHLTRTRKHPKPRSRRSRQPRNQSIAIDSRSKHPTTSVAGTRRTAYTAPTKSRSTECASTHTCMEPAACQNLTVPTVKRSTKQLNIKSDWPSPLPRPGDTIDLAYLAPLVQQQVADVPSEALVQTISNNKYTVSTLANQIESWVTHGFPLGHDGSLSGKHYTPNYKSSLEFRSGVTKSLLKRLETNKTAGPFAWTGDIADIPYPDCAINPIGAVSVMIVVTYVSSSLDTK